MSVWKNRNTWRWRVVRNGVELAGSGRTREEAKQAEARAVAQLSAGHTGIRAKRTLDEAMAEYLSSPEYLTLKSAANIADKAAQWAPYTAGKTLHQAPLAAQEATRAWLAAGLKPSTINRRLSLLRRVLNIAWRQWDWTADPIAQRIKLLPGEAQRQVWLTRAESIRLRRACKPGRHRAIITLLLTTGMRISELLNLRTDQVRDGAIFLDARTKTGRPRAIPVLPPGDRYLKHLPFRIGYDGVRTAYVEARAKAGLPHVTLHDLRHTVGTLLAEAGASTRDIQVWLGHTSPATTARYTHIQLSRLQEVARNVSARKLRAQKKISIK